MSTAQVVKSEQEKVAEALNKLVEFFNNPTEIPKFISKSYLEIINGKPSSKWSINNQMIMWAMGFTDARTYGQWQAVSRQVQKGEHGFYIIAPKTTNVKTIDKHSGEEKIIKVFTGFQICKYAMFGLEQTKGPEIKYVKEPAKLPPLFEVVKKMGLKVSYDATVQGEHGSYNPETDEIRLCTDALDTFFHELAHAVHKRIAGKLANGQDPEQETIAQLTACTLSEIYGYDARAYSYHYIKSYTGAKAGEKVAHVVATVQKILDYIFEVKRE